MIVSRVLAVLGGAFIVLATLMSAVRTVIVPRGVPVRLGRRVFLIMRYLFELRIGRDASYSHRDRVFALYGPVTLLILLFTWIALVFVGYTLIYLGLGVEPVREAVEVSGSSLFTLGFSHPNEMGPTIASFTQAAAGLILLTLLIAYLPMLYGVFSRREAAVTTLESRAGAPPSAAEFLERLWRIEYFDHLADVWTRWEDWFVELAETHTSFPALAFFRSPEPDHSWVIAAGTVLDTAALTCSSIDRPRDPRAELMIRAGYLALRRIAAFFGFVFDPDPKADDPISITRHEYEQVCLRLASAGVPLKRDGDQAWRDFAGWRVNYDTVLLELAALTQAPPAPWTGDRSPIVSGGPGPGRGRRARKARIAINERGSDTVIRPDASANATTAPAAPDGSLPSSDRSSARTRQPPRTRSPGST